MKIHDKQDSVVVPDNPFQPSLMFAGKTGAYLSEGHLKAAALLHARVYS